MRLLDALDRRVLDRVNESGRIGALRQQLKRRELPGGQTVSIALDDVDGIILQVIEATREEMSR